MTASDIAPPQQQPGVAAELSRDMGLIQVTMIGVGAMIGAGIFVLTGLAAGYAGPALLIVFVLNGLVALITAMSYAELGSCFPEAGGGYLWIREGLPQPNGFLSGWMSWFAHAVACSLYAYAFGAFAHDFLVRSGLDLGQFGVVQAAADALHWPVHDFLAKGFAVLVTGVFTYINYRGAEETGNAETVVTVVKLAVIGLFIGFGLSRMHADAPAWRREFTPFFPAENVHGEPIWIGILAAMGLTFIAFEGYEIIAQCGEEVVRPKRNIPLAIFISLGVVVPVYVLVALVALGTRQQPPELLDSGVRAWEWLGGMENPELAIVEVAHRLMPFGAFIFLIGGIFSTMSALNATIYSSSRVSFAMGRAYSLPSFLGRIHPRRRTPHWAVFLSGFFIAFMAVALRLEDIAGATDAMFLLLFMLVNLALINLRRHRADLERGFRVPWVPWIPLLGVAANLVLTFFLLSFSAKGILVCAGYLAAGVVIYFSYSRRREAAAVSAPVVFEQVTWPEKKGERILVALANPDTADALIDLAARIAGDEGGLLLLSVIRTPRQLAPSQADRFVRASEHFLQETLERQSGRSVPMRALMKVGHNVPAAIVETAEQRDADLVVLGWRGRLGRAQALFGPTIDEVLLNATCDVLMVRTKPGEPIRGIRRVLVPILSPDAARLALRVGRILSRDFDAEMTVFHVALAAGSRGRGPTAPEAEEEIRRDLERLKIDEAAVRVVAGGNVAARILGEIRDGDLLVMGDTDQGLLRRVILGTIPQQVARATTVPLILARPYAGPLRSWLQKLLGSRRSSLVPSAVRGEDDGGGPAGEG